MFDVFGDESAGDDHVSYGLVCVPSDEAAALGDRVAELRARHGLKELHCRVLFDARQRVKLGLERLTGAEVLSIYQELMTLMSSPNVSTVVARGRLSHFPGEQPADGHFPRVKFDKKSLGVMCANGAILPLKRDLTEAALRIWPGHDATRTEWLGRQRQPSQAIGGFYDIDGIRDERVSPSSVTDMPSAARRELFQIADLLAWLSNRTVAEKNLDWRGRYRTILDGLRPLRVSVLPGPTGMKFEVPYEWPDRGTAVG
jgi:hypothetical protein